MNEYIDTIFYFADTIQEYQIKHQAGLIHPRTIAFVAEDRGIYKNGVLYGRMSDQDLKEILEKIFEENPYVLPIATKYTGGTGDHIGGVMGGKYITINTANGVLSVDAYELFNDPSVQQLIKNVINKEYLKEEFNTKASYDQYGIVQIKREGGILVNGGLISIDPDISKWGKDIKDGLKGADGATPTIGSDGYWYINGKNTGVKAQGEKGEKGEKGDKGDTGEGGGSNNPQSVKYLVDIQSWYLITNIAEGVTINTPGWTLDTLTPTEQNRYLWRKDIYKYSDGTEIVKGPYLVGSLGEKGDRGDVGPGGGFDPATDLYITEINEKVIYNYNFIKNLIRGEIEYVDQLVNAIDSEIKDRVTNMITDAQWIQEHYEEGVIGHNDGWNDDMKAYLQRVGLWWEDDNGNITTRWTDILQRIGQIEADVNTLIQDPSGTLTTLQAALNLFADETTARVTLDTFWAKTNEMKEVISWMYSGLRNESSADHTWNDLISAAKGEDGGTAAANLHTGIERTLEGKFVAKGHLITELDGELKEKIASGVLTQTDPNYSFASLFADVQTNSRNYNDLHGQISTIVDMTDPLNAYVQQHMIAEATIYVVEMQDKTIIVDGQPKTVRVPVYYSDDTGMGRTTSPNKEENIYLHYIQDTKNGNPLWVITEDCTINNTNYNKGQVVEFNPGQYGEPKRIVKSQNSAGFITYADAEGAYSKMFAEDTTGDIQAKIEAVVHDNMSGIQITADNVIVDANHQLDLSSQQIILNSGNVKVQTNNDDYIILENHQRTAFNQTTSDPVFRVVDDGHTKICIGSDPYVADYNGDYQNFMGVYVPVVQINTSGEVLCGDSGIYGLGGYIHAQPNYTVLQNNNVVTSWTPTGSSTTYYYMGIQSRVPGIGLARLFVNENGDVKCKISV